jgi:hypothetical protein
MATTKLSFSEKLIKVQSELKAPKNMYNSFGKYSYRNQEGILEAVKPLLSSNGLCMTISDDIMEIGGRVYVKAIVKVFDSESEEIVEAFAREEENKKGMDSAQLTGSTSSYARKYALNGMFLIDDTQDSDATNTHGKEVAAPTKAPAPAPKRTPVTDIDKVIAALESNREKTIEQLTSFKILTTEQYNKLNLTKEEGKLLTVK